jgi:predicted nucleotidyltransferase
MSESNVNELVEQLNEIDGVEKVHVKTEVTVTHKKESTGEVDDAFNTIREPIVSEGKFQKVANDFGWNYLGTIDVVRDFHLRDRFTESFWSEEDE